MSYILSVITITYNDLSSLKYTLGSIENLPSNVEYIIVDGNSNDGTKEYLSALPASYSWISEPDKGLYDAMNKGLQMASGEYVIFMNSGDGFYTQKTLQVLLSQLQEKKPDVLYGETMYRDEDNIELGIRSDVTTRKLPNVLHWKYLKKGMLVCHQSYIVKRELAPNYVLDNLSADIDWMIETLKRSKDIHNADMIIANYLLGGISQKQHNKSLKDRFRVFVKHYGLTQAIWAHVIILFRALKHKLF